MSLSKIFTVKDVVNTVLLWLKHEMQGELEPELVKNFANLAVMEEAEKAAIANPSDYGQTVNVTDATVNVSTSIVTGVDYVNSTRSVYYVAHGLTISDVGKRVILRTATRAGIFQIESITDEDYFVTTYAFGADVLDQSMEYVVLSHYSLSTIDISSYNIMNITKLYSSVHKEVKKLGDIEADNIERNDFKSNKVFWYQHGEIIFLVIPSGASTGDLTLYYNAYPSKKTLDTDYFDIRDNYIPQVIHRTKKYCLEHLGLTPPESLTNIIEQKSEMNKSTKSERRTVIGVENLKGIDG
jgi:hypothetical protein